MTLTLPYPPSLNSYYRRVGNRTLKLPRARTLAKKFIGNSVPPKIAEALAAAQHEAVPA